jgi:hypothetical protein
MNDVLFDYLDDFYIAYLNDIMIYSKNELEHEEHVQKVLQWLCKGGCLRMPWACTVATLSKRGKILQEPFQRKGFLKD